LDEIDSGRSHVLTRSTTPTYFASGLAPENSKDRCDVPKTSTAKVSSMTVSLTEKAEALPFEEAVRKDSAVHVSLSSDSLVKHPGTLQLRPP
jgi:hypothetical protein